jgi:hypothetical protein
MDVNVLHENQVFSKLVKRAKIATSVALTMIGVFLVHAQSGSQADVDLNSAEHHFEALRYGRSLHTQRAFPDGAKGVLSPDPHEPGNTNIPVPAQFKDKNEWRAHNTYCSADAIVVGKLLNSTPILASTKSAVYTVSRFSVSQVIKSDGSISSGQTVVTYRLGGEVSDEGEKLRVDMPDTPAYKTNSSYVLVLTREKSASRPQYSTPDYGTISVNNNRVYSNLGNWAGLLPGTTLASVVAAFDHVAPGNCN